MPLISMKCPSCGRQTSVANQDVCLGVRCRSCRDVFMEAERHTDLSLLEWDPVARRKASKGLNGIVLAWLVLMIVGSFGLAALLVLGLLLTQGDVGVPSWYVIGTLVSCFLWFVCTVALFWRKTWGFAGICLLAAFAILLTLFSGGVLLLKFSVITIVVVVAATFFGILKIGTPSTWSQLE